MLASNQTDLIYSSKLVVDFKNNKTVTLPCFKLRATLQSSEVKIKTTLLQTERIVCSAFANEVDKEENTLHF